jgi:hypothetical protein
MSRKRNWEKIESDQAEKEKRQWEERERTITELFHAIEELVSRRVKREDLEGLIDEAKTLANDWKDPRSAKQPQNRRPLFDATNSDTNFLLAALVVSLRQSHQCLDKIRKYSPNELENLVSTSSAREFRAFVSALSGTLPEPPPTRKYERQRRSWRRNFFSSIEYQFGGAAEAERRKPLSHGLPYEPTCLDDIFVGETVNMQSLEDLFFGLERHRLSKALQGVQKRRYDYRAVAKIMEALLSEKRRKKRKRRGRPLRKPWLDDPNDTNRRRRVLTGIKARIHRLSVDEEICDTFLAVIRRHLPNSGKK